MAGLYIFLASLAMLFAAGLLGFLAVRFRAEQWPPPGTPPLPSGMWFGTLALVASSLTMHRATKALYSDDAKTLRHSLVATLILALAFVGSQVVGWLELINAYRQIDLGLHAFTFYMLTGLHGAHVLAGLIPLALVTRRSFEDSRYGPHNTIGVRQCAIYWHFLDGTWLIIFISLMLLS